MSRQVAWHERFFGRMERKGSCLVLNYSKNHKGYVLFWFKRKYWPAHRFSYWMFCGDIPEGALVCHACDNRACINPDHLFLGSHEDNMLDMRSKGRSLTGSRNPSSKLKESDVVFILSSNLSQRTLATKFGCRQSTISLIKRRMLWCHVKV